MKKLHLKYLLFLLFLGLSSSWFVIGANLPASAEGHNVKVVASPGFPVDTLTRNEIKEIFLGKKKHIDGQSINFIIFKSEFSQRSFLRNYLSKTIDQYNLFWKRQVFTGRGTPPKIFVSSDEVISYVKNSSNTISFVTQETPHDAVKLITVKQ